MQVLGDSICFCRSAVHFGEVRPATNPSARTTAADTTCQPTTSCWTSLPVQPVPPPALRVQQQPPPCAAAPSAGATAATASTCRPGEGQRKRRRPRTQPKKSEQRRGGCYAAATPGLIELHGRRCGVCESSARQLEKCSPVCKKTVSLCLYLLGTVLSPFWKHLIADCPSYPRQTSYAVRHHAITRLV